MSQEPLVQIHQLHKQFGKKIAVDHLNLNIWKGEIFGLLGSNGAGKTTTIECALGLKKADSGSISVLGKNPQHERQLLFQEVGVQFQESHYQDFVTVQEICEWRSSLYPKVHRWQDLAQRFGLGKAYRQPVKKLSGGERQRLSVILALLHEPKLVFLDELTTGLDPVSRREIWAFLKELNQDGLTLLLTSHYMDEVEALCSRILVLHQGKEIETGFIEECISRSQKRTLEEAYLGWMQTQTTTTGASK